MARYKGKREASKAGGAEQGGLGKLQEVFAKKEKEEVEEYPAAPEQLEAVSDHIPVGDPFAPEEPREVFDDMPAERKGLGRFFRSTVGKVVIVALCCVLAFAVGGAIALDGWVKPPELPVSTNDPQKPDTGDKKPSAGDDKLEEAPPPGDDELYPDDGYDGDMPTVSGDRKEGVYTFLLVGTDKDDGNTDTIMVASYDTVNQTVNIMSIPRDTMINESWDIKKINSIYSRTGSSIDSLANRVRKLVGFKPDFYVKVDLSMFVELVDLIGGVDFYVPQDMYYSDPWQDLLIDLKEGQQVLDGEKAMQLVRFRRYAEGDIKRVEVQQSFLKALIKECLSLKHWGKMKAYIELALDNVQTDLDFGSVVWFAANVMGLYDAPVLDMANVNTHTIPGNYFNEAWSRDVGGMQSYVTIYPNETVKLVNAYFNPYVQNVTTGMMDIMSIKENGDIASSTGNLKDTKHNAIMAVRRGEAYYDDDGNIIYGEPPVEPEMDAFGNYYILDESGNVVYTDENGAPLEGQLPVISPGLPVANPSQGTASDPSQSIVPDPSQGNVSDPGVQQPVLPETPVTDGNTQQPVVDSTVGGSDEDIPDWLRPAA